jgi:hypothetical protein
MTVNIFETEASGALTVIARAVVTTGTPTCVIRLRKSMG